MVTVMVVTRSQQLATESKAASPQKKEGCSSVISAVDANIAVVDVVAAISIPIVDAAAAAVNLLVGIEIYCDHD